MLHGYRVGAICISADGTNACVVVIKEHSTGQVWVSANLAASGAGSAWHQFFGEDGVGVPNEGIDITTTAGSPIVTFFVK